TLIGTGLKLSAPTLGAVPTSGSKTTIQLPFTIKDRKQLPKKVQASVRWDPIDVPLVPSDPTHEVAGGGAGAAGSGAAAAGAATTPPTTGAPSASKAPATSAPSGAPRPTGVGATA